MCVYFDKKGRKYKGRVRVCENCGDKKTVRITVTSNLCRKCGTTNRPNTLSNGALFTVGRNGKRRRAEYRVCITCGKKRLVRMDTSHEMEQCVHCRARELGKKYGPINGPKQFKTGIGIYRARALRFFKEKCIQCEASHDDRKIIIHHIDEDRKNNDISNLIPLCHSCHRNLHNAIRRKNGTQKHHIF